MEDLTNSMEHSFPWMVDQLQSETQNSRAENILHPATAQYDEAEKFCLQLISEAWEMLVPSSIQEKLEYKKLTFYLHIHFAVLPLRKQSKVFLDNNLSIQPGSRCSDTNAEQSKVEDMSAEKYVLELNRSEQLETDNHVEMVEETSETDHSFGMEVLRNFLETKGTEFSTEPEFLPYYALPFVSDPPSHPSFQELFTESWVNQLSSSLRDFVVEHSWGTVVAPQLLKLGLETQRDTTHKLHSQLLEAHKNFKQLKRRYQKLHKDHHNLIGIAAELTGALENSVKGQAVDLRETLNNCCNIFPDLFGQLPGAGFQPEAVAEEEVHRSVVHNHEDQAGSSFGLDFRKIKQHLLCGSVKTKLLLFQALRWRITRSSPEDRDSVAELYFRHDVLSLHRSSSHPLSVLGDRCESPKQLPLSEHFNPTHASTPHPLQQVTARFVNTLASLRCGRDYLCSAGCKVLSVLVPCLQGDNGVKVDSVTTDMILATLQKLSLRHSQRLGMIDLGLVEWLIQRLSAADVNSMKAYTLEYSTALLMNLCLHRRAKERCVPFAKTVLKLLMVLLGSKVRQAIPYVNGTLYSLLVHPQLNHEAKRMGLCSVLEFYLKNCDGEMSKQLEYILKLHRGDCQSDHSSMSDEDNADDDTEEVDLLEEELDSDDPVRSLHGELNGDQLLYRQYHLVFPYHGIVHPSSSSTTQSVRDTLLRPTTPHHVSLGSLDGKYPAARSTTSVQFCRTENKEEELSETCPKTCESVVQENAQEEEEDENDAVVCNVTSACSSYTDCKLNDSEPLYSTTDSSSNKMAAVCPSQPLPASQDGEDEYSKAFSSRPKIPRTPTF